MPIDRANLPAVILLLEVDLQCKILLRASESLRRAAEHWNAFARGVDDGTTAPPIEVVKECGACLSAATAISRMLILGDRRGKRSARIPKRCAVLMNLLGNPKLDALSSMTVRNSWEHLDERLDEVLSALSYTSYEEIRVAAAPADPKTFVHRQFDPVSLEIRQGPDSVPLEPLIGECQELVKRVETALRLLQSEVHQPY